MAAGSALRPLSSMRATYTAQVPAAKGGLPSDIANAVLYLTSDLGQYVNGETILVDGGMIAAKKMGG